MSTQEHKTKTKKPLNWRALTVGIIAIVLLIAGFIASLGIKEWKFFEGTQFFVKQILLNNFLGVNAILIGFLVFVGYLMLGRGFQDSLLGFMKAAIGTIILAIGAGTLVEMAKPVFASISSLGTNVVPLDPYFGWTAAQNWLNNVAITGGTFASWISYTMLLAFFINIALVALRRWTNVHSLMITGHVMFQQAAIVVVTVFFTMFNKEFFFSTGPKIGAQIGVILTSSVILGTYWGVASTATIKGSDVVTQGAGFAVGHQQMIGLSIAYGIGRFFGKKADSAETKVLSNKIKLLEDNIFTQSIILLLLFTILILIIQFAKPSDANALAAINKVRFAAADGTVAGAYGQWKVSGPSFWAVNLVLGSLKLVGSILVLQMGVRMFVTELQQSFQGISEKLVPGAVVAVDVAATYGFSPNSVTYGFVSGTIAQYAAMGLLIGLSFIPKFDLVVPIPLFITLFFNSGSIGVFANASGGWKASIIVPAIFGFLGVTVIAFGLYIMKNFGVNSTSIFNDAKAFPFATGYIGMFDWNFVWGLLVLVSSWSSIASAVVMTLYVAGLYIAAQIIDSNRQHKPTGLQKLFKISPNLDFAEQEAAMKAAAA